MSLSDVLVLAQLPAMHRTNVTTADATPSCGCDSIALVACGGKGRLKTAMWAAKQNPAKQNSAKQNPAPPATKPTAQPRTLQQPHNAHLKEFELLV